MSRESTLSYTAIREQFRELANLIENEMTVYLIGGGALTLQELKSATKDIDLIVREKYELEQLWAALETAGYEPSEDLDQGTTNSKRRSSSKMESVGSMCFTDRSQVFSYSVTAWKNGVNTSSTMVP